MIRLTKTLKHHPKSVKPSSMILKSFKTYFISKNKQFSTGIPQFLYLFWLGFLLVAIVVPFYYLSFDLIGVTVSTIVVNAVPILVIAFINHLQKRDQLDAFKLIELFLLMCGIITIGLSYGSSNDSNIPSLGIIVIFLAVIAFILYSVGIEKDSLKNISLFDEKVLESSQFGVKNNLHNMMVGLRSFYKLFGIHFGGLLANLITTGFFALVDHFSVIGVQSREMFHEFLNFPSLLFNLPLIAIAIVCTLIPYTFQVFAVTNWPKFSLGFTSWNSMLTVLQPLAGLFIGYYFWKDPIPYDYILFTTIFLVISLVIRYFHENANLQLILFRIRVKNQNLREVIRNLQNFSEIFEINITLGRIGILAHGNIQSVPRLFSILQKIEATPGVLTVEYFDEVLVK